MNPGQMPTQSSTSQTNMSWKINFFAHCKVPRSKISCHHLIDEVSKLTIKPNNFFSIINVSFYILAIYVYN